jgi:predicted transcriptional regulator
MLRERLMANPSTFYKAIRSLIKKGLVKELKLNHEKIVCIDI